MTTFDHPAFADDQPWRGCTTESLRWKDEDYDATAGTVAFRPSTQADSSPHLFFVDLVVHTNDGREIVLERVEGGKILSSLLATEQVCQAAKDRETVVTHRCIPEWT